MTNEELAGKSKLISALKKYELSFEEKYEPEDIEVEFSRQYEHHIQKLLYGKTPAYGKWRGIFVRSMAACLAIVAVVLVGSVTVRAVREPVVEFFANLYEKFVEIFFDDEDIENAPDTIESVYTLGYIPTGYEYSEFYSNKAMTESVWSCGEDYIILCQYVFDGRTDLDNENSEYENFYIDGVKIASIEKMGRKTLLWNTDKYSFTLSISTDITKEEYVMMISSITEKDLWEKEK